ncbi:hypothetical protein SFC43_26290 [Bacteroides sp. CR5/BHMF/2]|nr:hypothetical protein [Bacteroides sp. CR5/BHMF/2]
MAGIVLLAISFPGEGNILQVSKKLLEAKKFAGIIMKQVNLIT